MSARIRHHIRSNVIGYLALFVALSGTAYAIDGPLPGQDQVGSADIINGEVKNNDLGANAVATGKIGNGQVQSSDLANGVISDDVLNPAKGSTKIAEGAIQSSELSNSSVFGSEVAPNALTGNDIATNTVAGLEVADQSLGSVDLGPGSVGSSEVADGTVQPVDLAEEARGPAGFEVRKSSTGLICNNYCTEGTLSLPSGFYAIFGKIEVQNSVDVDALLIRCELTSGGQVFDGAGFAAPDAVGTTLSMQGMRLFIDRGNVNLNCRDFDTGLDGWDLKISAIKLGTVTSKVAPPED